MLKTFPWKNKTLNIAVACLVHTIYICYTHVFTVFTKFISFDYDRVQKLWMVIYLYQFKKRIRYMYFQRYIQGACMYLQFKWVCDVSRPVLINKIQTNFLDRYMKLTTRLDYVGM